MIHETLKEIGYKNIISEYLWTNEGNTYLDVSKKPKDLIDSLEITYKNYNESPKYYKEFWERRKREKNEKIVYQTIKEIKQEMIDSVNVIVERKIVNDTLLNLLSFEYPQRELTNEESNELLKYLMKIGLHESAYNLISGENKEFEEVKWNRNVEEIVEELEESNTFDNLNPWFLDDTK